MKRNIYLGLLVCGAGRAVTAGEEPVRPPNFVVITADDLGFQLGCYGDPQAHTPNIDRLASEGVRFNQGHITQASCAPSRASILTGLFPIENGHWALPEFARLKPGMPLLPNLLSEAGYRTAILGKEHVRSSPGERIRWDYEWAKVGQTELTRDVREMARQAGLFLKETGDRPFFLYVNYFDPHRPGATPPRGEAYTSEQDQVKGIPEKVLKPGDVKPMSFIGIDEPPQLLLDVATYYNCIHRLDVGIGLLMDVLKDHGAENNTLILFISDNGPDFPRGKITCYDAGVRVPFIVRWPGVVRPGRVSDALVSGVDIAPTLLSAANAAPDKVSRMSGISILPILRESAETVREFLPVEYTSHAGPRQYYPRRGITDGKYLYILNLMAGTRNPFIIGPWKMPAPGHRMYEAYQRLVMPPPEELYDIQKDPDCLINLAENPERGVVLETMRGTVQAWREEKKDRLLDPQEIERVLGEMKAEIK